MPKDQAPTVVPIESNNSEGGGYEAHSEQLVLSPTTSQRITAQTEAENEESSNAKQLATHEQRRKGKSKGTTEADSNYKLLALLKEMKA